MTGFIINALGGYTEQQMQSRLTDERKKPETELALRKSELEAKRGEIDLKNYENQQRLTTKMQATKALMENVPFTHANVRIFEGANGPDFEYDQHYDGVAASIIRKNDAETRNIDADTEKKHVETEAMKRSMNGSTKKTWSG